MRRKTNHSRPVYATDLGKLCPQCHRAVSDCVCGKDRPAATGDGIVRLQLQKKGRGGKAVTVISGLPLAPNDLKVLAKQLKQRCGVGGAVKGDLVEIQGDQRKLLQDLLSEQGYTVKLAGG